MRFLLICMLLISCSKNDDYSFKNYSSNEDSLYKNSSFKDSTNNFSFYDGLASYNIQHNGLTRQYLLYIPPSIQSRTNLPAIFNFHGYSGQADQFFSSTNLIDIADSNGVVLVYPQGALLNGGDSHWNAAPMNSNSFLNKSDVDDIGFIMTLLDEVNQNNILDLKRVYAIGYSNGGMFSHFLACNTDNVFAAIGDVAGTMLLDTFNTCDPSSSVPVLKIHGTNDNVVLYNGYEEDGYKTVIDVVDFWKQNNSINNEYIFSSMSSSSWANYMGPVDFEKYKFGEEQDNSSVVLYKVLRGGHWWDYSLDDDLKTSSLLWEFFSKHSK